MNQLNDLIPRTFFKFQNELKLYHWRTYSYSRHVATDKLYNDLLDLIDEFVEVYMGKFNNRVEIIDKPITIKNYNEKNVNKLFNNFKKFLLNLNFPNKKNTSDLYNIRDEILVLIENTKYRFTLK